MRTFAQKQKATQQTPSAKPTIPGRAHLGQRHEVNSILHLQRTIGNQAVQRWLQNNPEEHDALLSGTNSPHFGHDFSRIPVRSPTVVGGIQTKLAINMPGDEYEQEADRVADQVIPSQEHERLQTKRVRASGTEQAVAPPIVHDVMHSSGQPLDAATRAFMEPRFGHNFSQVRVHTDDQAAASALDVNARAYTVGDDIVFGKGQYHLSAASSQRLIAHELAHVVQQRNTGQAAVARQLDYEETGRNITRANLEDNFKATYWEQKVMEVYSLKYGTDRLSKDPEERDAVLSVLWAKQPAAGFAAYQKVDVEIPARATTPIGKPLLYRFKFTPADPMVAGSKPGVEVEFIAAGLTTAITPAKPPGSYSPSVSSYSMSDFPSAYPDYFSTFPDEERHLFHWVEKTAPTKFNQLLKIQTSTTKKKVTTTRETSFFVEGEKDKKGKVLTLSLRYMGTYQPIMQSVPADYHSKDYADVLVERAQTTPDEVGGDTLGKINLPTGISAEEQFAVKYYVQSYFKFYTDNKGAKVKGTRTSEVDAIVIIPNRPTKILYTLRFQANNDVDVERVGELGTGASQLNPNKLDVARSPEYTDKAQDPKKFAAWLKVRYPQVPVVGTTVEEMRNNVNAEAEAKAETPEWFKNYEIKVLDDADAKTRLKNAHKYKPEQLADFKTFKPFELRVLEIALETMARKILDVIKYTRLVRQRMSVSLQPDKTWAEEPNVAGRAAQYASNKTVIIFDGAFTGGDPTQFMGGTGGFVPEETDIYAHEFGHLVGSSSVQSKFDAFVAKNGIKPFTKYSKEKVAAGEPKEFFAEAFSMYQTDPEWMKTNYPLLNAWFETLAKTGAPPTK